MKLFGTDGIRGLANVSPIVPSIITRVAMAAGKLCSDKDRRHTVVIGKDTRISGYMIDSALTAGFISMGMDVVGVGPLPTPGISMLTRSLRADLGVMISASHNHYKDNGIKFFGADGYKLSNALENEIEKLVNDSTLEQNGVTAENMGKAIHLHGATERYVEYIKNTIPRGMSFDGLKVVIDCANGAAYNIAPKVLWELGANVISVGIEPDGFNINEKVGALHYQSMQQAVLDNGADLGIALDGDADRVVLSDEKGNVINGDHIIAIIAREWQKKEKLRSSKIIGTVMSNMGLQEFLQNIGLDFIRSPVGDKHVCHYMHKYNSNVGGEQSGHIILSDFSCTGDGLVAALQIIEVLISSGKLASQLFSVFEEFPQVLLNTNYNSVNPLEGKRVKNAIKEVEEQIGDNGRVLVRKSGTEPLVRIMIEARCDNSSLQEYANIIKQEIN